MPRTDASKSHRCGFAVLVGPPNAGKSTLFNCLLGVQAAAVSAKPQTTRTRIRGVITTGSNQMILLDTPGIHKHPGALNAFMQAEAAAARDEADVVAVVLEMPSTARGPSLVRPDVGVAQVKSIAENFAEPPVIVLNKIDCIRDKRALLPVIKVLGDAYPGAEIVPLSAKTGENTGALLTILAGKMPQGPALFPPDIALDQAEKVWVAEMIREKVFQLLHDELPYRTAVETLSWTERENKETIVIGARIMVEKESQKAIVIGRGGQMLKRIGTAARGDIERFLGARIFLDIVVSVVPDWSEDGRWLARLGYRAG